MLGATDVDESQGSIWKTCAVDELTGLRRGCNHEALKSVDDLGLTEKEVQVSSFAAGCSREIYKKELICSMGTG